MEKQDRTEKRAREEVWRQNLKYDIALRAGLAPARADRDLKGQSLRYAEASAAMRQKELQAREVLMRRGLFRTQFMGHVPRLVEIGSGPHTTLVNLPCFVNFCRWHGAIERRQQRGNVSMAVYSAEVLLDM